MFLLHGLLAGERVVDHMRIFVPGNRRKENSRFWKSCGQNSSPLTLLLEISIGMPIIANRQKKITPIDRPRMGKVLRLFSAMQNHFHFEKISILLLGWNWRYARFRCDKSFRDGSEPWHCPLSNDHYQVESIGKSRFGQCQRLQIQDLRGASGFVLGFRRLQQDSSMLINTGN